MRKNSIGIFFIIIIIGIIFLFISGCDLIKETFDSELEKLSSQSSSISEPSSSTGNISSSASIPGSSSTSSFSSSSQSSISNSLVAEYLFNGNANDYSGYGNNGVLNNITFVSDRFGNPNGTAHFAGNVNSYINCSANI